MSGVAAELTIRYPDGPRSAAYSPLEIGKRAREVSPILGCFTSVAAHMRCSVHIGRRPPDVRHRAWQARHVIRILAALSAAVVLPLAGLSDGLQRTQAAPTAAAATAVRYAKPVPGAVVRGFEPPPTLYAAGHRGVDLATVPGEAVRAAADGTVNYAGVVAGRGVVVVAHADGISTEYEPVTASVSAGDEVVRGEIIATISGTHGTCATGACLHWGARRGDAYLNPLGLLNLGILRLLPWSG